MSARCNTIIESLGVYLPEKAASTREVMAGCRKRLYFPLELMTGIRSRRVAGEGEFAHELAARAIERCLARSRHQPGDIDLVISCGISRYAAADCFAFEPGTAIRLRRQFGFENAVTLDVSNACAGVFTGIYLADALLKSGAARRALVVSGEFITPLTATAQREISGYDDPRLACLTLGDSGLAVMLESGPNGAVGFQELEIFTLSQFSEYCIAKASDHQGGGAIMLTDVVKLSAAAIEEASQHAVAVQKRLGWDPSCIDHVIMHQTSERTIKEGMKKINQLFGEPICTDANTIINLRDRGNTATTSHFVAFEDHILNDRIHPGDHVVFSVNASGLTVGTALYTCDDLTARIHAPGANGKTKPTAGSAAPRAVRKLTGTPFARIHCAGAVPLDLPMTKETLALSRAAAEDCLERARHSRDEIDLLIFAGVYRTGYLCEPAIAALIARELNLGADAGKRILCFDVGDGAAGMLKASYLAARMIESGRARLALVIASEIDPNVSVPNAPLLDIEATASALLLEPAGDGARGFGSFTFQYFPEHLDGFRADCDLSVPGGALKIAKNPRWEEICLEAMAAAVEGHFAATGMERGRVARVLAPQVSPEFIARLGARLGLADRMVDAVRGHKDLYSSSFPYAWREMEAGPAAQPGDVALVIALGAGLQVICNAYHLG